MQGCLEPAQGAGRLEAAQGSSNVAEGAGLAAELRIPGPDPRAEGGSGVPSQPRGRGVQTPVQNQIRLLGEALGRASRNTAEELKRGGKIVLWMFSLDFQLTLLLQQKGTELYVTWLEG